MDVVFQRSMNAPMVRYGTSGLHFTPKMEVRGALAVCACLHYMPPLQKKKFVGGNNLKSAFACTPSLDDGWIINRYYTACHELVTRAMAITTAWCMLSGVYK